MVRLGATAQKAFENLCYYPFTTGKHLERTIADINDIQRELEGLEDAPTPIKITIPNIGNVSYFTSNGNVYVLNIQWNTTLMGFYYNRANFITFTRSRNIRSVHPIRYQIRPESNFRCDNGFQVVSRKSGRREVFNFIDCSNGYPKLVSDIDFIQVIPFDGNKGMTARGFTPDKKCWAVYEDGTRHQVNENKKSRYNCIYLKEQNNNNNTNKIIKMNNKKVVRLTESQLHDIIAESVEQILMESGNTEWGRYLGGLALARAKRENRKEDAENLQTNLINAGKKYANGDHRHAQVGIKDQERIMNYGDDAANPHHPEDLRGAAQTYMKYSKQMRDNHFNTLRNPKTEPQKPNLKDLRNRYR